jgi:hypothetical protein
LSEDKPERERPHFTRGGENFRREEPVKPATTTTETTTGEEKKVEEPKRPRFSGGVFKKLLATQDEANADANVGLDEYKKKLEETIKIHEPKPPRKENPTDAPAKDDEFD